MWTQEEAIALCKIVEGIAPQFGAHVALTGGCLYKSGPRKDVDLLFYCIRQVDFIDRAGLFEALSEIGMVIEKRFGWCQKANWYGKAVDMFFPEEFPATSQKMTKDESTGEYV